ncbi:hypothetical protein H8A97_24630 [Bradyrhizobium sp. Arg62]|uniref:hypothetical protein n=1 Tax=Bradyrhizobium brasilense TaxID=1419277 RepID=UPI001E2F7C5D|nr:hypothetical protein [Bradyrhizobium brasilense]MCC8948207.1 hypothetical protein [Bradyrhizobium brasilense]
MPRPLKTREKREYTARRRYAAGFCELSCGEAFEERFALLLSIVAEQNLAQVNTAMRSLSESYYFVRELASFPFD